MDFTLKPEVEDFRKRIRNFVETHVIPLEANPSSYDKGENITEDLIASWMCACNIAIHGVLVCVPLRMHDCMFHTF